MDLEYRYPADYFGVPEGERSARVYFHPDLCVIDKNLRIVRGVLQIPVPTDGAVFGWGIWARVEQDMVDEYLKYWSVDPPEGMPFFPGYLSGGIKSYEGSDDLAVTVHLQAAGQRPLFKVISETHPLGVDQRKGVTMREVHRWLNSEMPELFK